MSNTGLDLAKEAIIALSKTGVAELGIKLVQEACHLDNQNGGHRSFPSDFLDWAREIIYYSKTCEQYRDRVRYSDCATVEQTKDYISGLIGNFFQRPEFQEDMRKISNILLNDRDDAHRSVIGLTRGIILKTAVAGPKMAHLYKNTAAFEFLVLNRVGGTPEGCRPLTEPCVRVRTRLFMRLQD